MKKIYSMFVLINSYLLFAQSPNIEWQKTFGGDGIDILDSINQTNDGGFIIGGASTSGISGDKTVPLNGNTSGDYWIIKTDAQGNIEWQKSIGGFGGETISKIVQTSDNGYIIGGVSYSNASGDKTENSYGSADYWVVRLDESGNILWDKTLGGFGNEFFNAIIQTTDGGFLVGGDSDSIISGNKTENCIGYAPPLSPNGSTDFWVVKLDANGEIEWQNTIGGTDTDIIGDMVNTTDGGYLIGGRSDSNVSGDKTENSRGSSDYWVLKLNILGEIVWQKTIGGNRFDRLNAISNTDDDGYLLGGTSSSDISGEKSENALVFQGTDMWVVKLDVTGTIVWQKTIGGTGGDFLRSIAKDNHGDFLVAGNSDSNASFNKTENSRGSSDFWAVKISSSGTIQWDKTIGGAEADGSYAASYSTINDSFILGGRSLSSATGDKSETSRGLNDYWIVKLESETLSTTNFNQASVKVYPNPTVKTIHIKSSKTYKEIKVRVTNILGQEVQIEKFNNTSEISFDLMEEKGIYFLEINNENDEKIEVKVIKN